MKTTRFETFMDAVLAIIITVLVLKLAQPDSATVDGILKLNMRYLTYFVCFVVIFNTWYNDHNLFQIVEEIDNSVVFTYGVTIFVISLIPYFASWVYLNPTFVPTQTMFGLLFLAINVLYTISTYLIVRADPYNERLKRVNLKDVRRHIPVLIILIGFVLTYTVYVKAIYISCIIATVYSLILSIITPSEIESSERFEALFDAIVAIILTIIVLEIPMAATGLWTSLWDIRLEFVAYVISFIVCFNYWNYNNNIFHLVNRIDGKVIWSVAASMFFLSLIPYLSTFVAENFYSFVAQASYGVDFILITIASMITIKTLKNVDKANIALLVSLDYHHLIFTVAIVAVGMVIGYFAYPPAIIASCLISILAIWSWPYLKRL